MHQSIPHPAALSSRTLEKQALKSLLDRKGSQLVAVTGRRRVGKTFLVRNTIDKRSIFLEITGKKRASKVDLRDNFLSSYEEKFKPIAKLSRDLSWREIFKVLSAESKRSKNRDFTLFLDELPWMAQSDHDFLPALEHIWNNDWSQIAQFKLIICGSAASWMNEHIFNNTDGLFGRLTGRLDLLPFTLSQCSEFSASRSLGLNSQQLLEYYLVLGGVPYYWTLIERDEPAAEFVQRSFFDKSPLLVNEFNLMLEALFRDSKAYGAIINALGKSRYGLSREELATVTKVSAGGTLERALNELCDCAFVTRYVPFKYAEKGMYFRLTDQFMLFNVVWLAKRDRTGVKSSVAYWHKQRSTGKYHNWIGSSFEVFCQKHIDAILLALGISGIRSEVSTWRTPLKTADRKIQIDLVIDRADDVVTLVECKYSEKPLSFTRKEITHFQERQSIFVEQSGTKKFVNSILVSAKPNRSQQHLDQAFYKTMHVDELFKF